jgi:uncharacterized protein YbjT (DUF2867 family)
MYLTAILRLLNLRAKVAESNQNTSLQGKRAILSEGDVVRFSVNFLLFMRTVFITGGTGYIGSRLIKALLQTGELHVKALVRSSSKDKLPPGCEVIIGNALKAETYVHAVPPASIFIHLVGVAHPSPSKKQQFRDIDLASVLEAAGAAKQTGIDHFVYLSVAQFPTKIMKEYQAVRATGEAVLSATGIRCSFVRPWYVLGPGHWWPILLKPFYLMGPLIPSLREKADKLDTVTIRQMIRTLQYAVKHLPESAVSIYEVADIKSMHLKNV